MFTAFITSLRDWHATTGERAKLQHAYIVTAAGLLIVAGVIGLVNYSIGQQLLLLALALFMTFIANAVMWALLQSFVLSRLTVVKPTAKRSARK